MELAVGVRNVRAATQTRNMRPRALRSNPTPPEVTAVSSWRRGLLVRAGFPPALASELANDGRTDVHALLELIDRGCPPELAARILAPLESEHEGRHSAPPARV